MRAILYFLLVALAQISTTATDDKEKNTIDVKKLVGKWKLAEKGKHPMVIQFRKDGTMTATLTVKEEEYNLSGRYRTDGNKVVIVLNEYVEHDQVYVINKLTDTELVWIAERDKEKQTATRVHDK